MQAASQMSGAACFFLANWPLTQGFSPLWPERPQQPYWPEHFRPVGCSPKHTKALFPPRSGLFRPSATPAGFQTEEQSCWTAFSISIRLFALLAINDIFVGSPMFDSYICLGAQGSGAGSEKDPSAAESSPISLCEGYLERLGLCRCLHYVAT